MKKTIYIIAIGLMLIGCGGGSSGSSSSFSTSDNAPVIDNLETEDKENIIPITGAEVNISVKENTREAFKINATDRSNLTYYLTEGDFHDLYIDPKRGEAFFKKPTNYEEKSVYKFKILIEDSVGHETKQQVVITVRDTINETAPIKEIELNSGLTEEEKKYFITTWKTDNDGTSNNNQITIPTAGDGYNYSVDWGDRTSSKNLTQDAKHTYKKSGTYQVKIIGDFPRIYFGQGVDYDLNTYENDSRKLLSIDQWGTNEWKSMAGAFTECTNLEGKASDRPDLSDVKDMSTMFAVSNFNQNINDWDMSGVEKIPMMFFFSAFNQNIANWNTSNITDMTGLFGASVFNRDIGQWDTSKVDSMVMIFFSNISFNQDISRWDTSSVTEMSLMFGASETFNQDITQWDTSQVKGMLGMFLGAKSFNQNINKWDVSNVTDMAQMFQFAQSFNQDLEDWHVSKETNTTDMFTATDALSQLPTWYSVDDEIKKRDFIVVSQNTDADICKVAYISANIEGNIFGSFFEFNKNIDKSNLVASIKNKKFTCEDYGREDDLVDCSIMDMEQLQGTSCIVGFNFEK